MVKSRPSEGKGRSDLDLIHSEGVEGGEREKDDGGDECTIATDGKKG